MKIHGFGTEVLAASFTNSQQILELYCRGIGAITAHPDTLERLVENLLVDSAVNEFISDFELLTGKGETMTSCRR